MDTPRRDQLISVSLILVGILALAVVWWLTRPNDDDGARSREESSQSASPGTSGPVGEKRPVRPGPFDSVSAADVETTLRFYYDALNYAQRTGDVSALDDVFATSCDRCEILRSALTGVHENGGRFEGGEYTVTALSDVYGIPTETGIPTMTATVTTKRADLTGRRADGSIATQAPADEASALFSLEFRQGFWEILYIGQKD